MRLSSPTTRETTESLAHTLRGPQFGAVVVIRPERGSRGFHSSFASLSSHTKHVHINGHPFLWAVEEILRRAPNLKVLQVTPPMLRHIHEASPHVGLLKSRGVQLVPGYVNPEIAWANDGSPRDPRFFQLQRMLLVPERRAALDELITFGFEMAAFTKRYFCLDGEDYLPYRKLAEQLDFYTHHEALISYQVNGIVHYLNPEYAVIDRSTQYVRALRQRVARARVLAADAVQMRALLDRLGLAGWPLGLPLARVDVFERVLAAWREDGLGRLDEQERAVLVQRFGLGETLAVTLGNVQLPGGQRSRERVRQIEVQALRRLEIKDDDG